ncbi:hypothetical protein KIN20_029700 [Parelaphostrongylus tenuis]|uniref:Uncharacterized protein n=1 Tax=Parelaphostrongylus tenuis TaxID=148309 RepID=A0AAD5R2X8_PARTN|nr:hypothetical protein KIN20_029700 [Parelaphostrongylus tenuis]
MADEIFDVSLFKDDLVAINQQTEITRSTKITPKTNECGQWTHVIDSEEDEDVDMLDYRLNTQISVSGLAYGNAFSVPLYQRENAKERTDGQFHTISLPSSKTTKSVTDLKKTSAAKLTYSDRFFKTSRRTTFYNPGSEIVHTFRFYRDVHYANSVGEITDISDKILKTSDCTVPPSKQNN